ncbi:lytic transglycosylase domain-containing protein [Brevundimonas guildfordensis]|uniref:Lytic transglycosylase domain-containing protein n=1 Tax=Brevundimonas guildfordensis TaxID=2762241 RepID=A0ABR8R266_9CAUL|nr:lytic transglycosylase domain-containing protein [Brevundimonas guildfordensis]MBD7941895.1 lytic transglycosylase domain-containing protein [Brevundimonas guildfordensis]
MYSFRRTRRASLFAFALGALVAGAAQADEADSSRPYVATAAMAGASPTALSSEDRLSYTTAFDALRRGDLELARASARQAKDRVLLGQVEFERLFHPSHVAAYDELAAWLETYSDLPMADRVYTLAMQRLPDGAPEPKRPGGLLTRTWASLTGPGDGGVNDPAKAARVALNNDDLAGAYAMGQQIGDWWTAGLAAWRMDQHSDAFRAFEHVAQDPTEDPWVRSGGAFWAARAAAQSGRQERVVEYLRQAARWPATFYGQIALHQLGEEPEIENLGPRSYEATLQRASLAPEPIGVDTRTLNAFIQSDEDARRTVALYEVGRRNDAELSARNGLRAASGDSSARQMWAGLYRLVAPSRAAQSEASRIDALRYPMPELQPMGGFTIEKALVYAIARKETDFNANARSGAGAYGLMQVMPTTAAHMTGDQGYVRTPQRLLDPAVNMKLGQDYVNRLFQIESFQGDLLKAVASYNAGPGPMLAAIRKLGADADPLLLIESIDVPQARDYVEKVVASYWIYQRMMGGPVKTLEALASGARAVPIRLDYTPPAPAPLQVAEAMLGGGSR